MKITFCSALALAACGLAACSPSGYEMTVDEAVEKLRSAPIPVSANAFENPFPGLDVSTSIPAPGTVAWSSLGEVLCTASVSPIDDTHVSVATSCPGIDPNTGAQTAESRLSDGVEEFVSATLEGRAIDGSKVMMDGMIAAGASHPQNVQNALGDNGAADEYQGVDDYGAADDYAVE